MRDVRCSSCGKLLARAIYTQLEIKCPRCRAINSLGTPSPEPERRERLYPDQTHGITHHSVARRQTTPGR